METFLYVVIFVIGTFFGSFFTLAVYRIPKGEDILIKHSYCPNCNHKLGFFDLFPILSYILLHGQCRYCGNKIRPRYLILELLTGFTFLSVAISTKISINGSYIVDTIAILLYISVLFIIAGIDKEKKSIQRSVLAFGYIVEILYIIYQCTLKNFNVYQYVIYLIFLIILLMIDCLSLKIFAQKKYFIQILYLSLYMIIWGGSQIYILTVILTFMIVFIYQILSQQKNKELPIGFYLSVSNILMIIIANTITNYLA